MHSSTFLKTWTRRECECYWKPPVWWLGEVCVSSWRSRDHIIPTYKHFYHPFSNQAAVVLLWNSVKDEPSLSFCFSCHFIYIFLFVCGTAHFSVELYLSYAYHLSKCCAYATGFGSHRNLRYASWRWFLYCLLAYIDWSAKDLSRERILSEDNTLL